MIASIGNWAYVLKSKLGVASARRGEDALKLAHRVRHIRKVTAQLAATR